MTLPEFYSWSKLHSLIFRKFSSHISVPQFINSHSQKQITAFDAQLAPHQMMARIQTKIFIITPFYLWYFYVCSPIITNQAEILDYIDRRLIVDKDI